MEYQFDHRPMCKYCTNAKPIPYTEDMLCKRCGAVPETHVCKKFKYNLLARDVRRKKGLDVTKFSAEDFSLDD